MSLRKVKIVNCKTASIRRTPWIPLLEKDISGFRKSASTTNPTLSSGTYVEIYTDKVCYNWQGRKFYKVKNPTGWIYAGCIDYREDDDSGRDSSNSD